MGIPRGNQEEREKLINKKHATVKLSSFASGLPFQHDLGECVEGAMRRRGVGGENWGLAIGVAEVVVENVVRARFCFGVFNGSCYLKVFSGWWRVIGG